MLSPKQASQCPIHLALRNACLPSTWSQVQATSNGQVAGLHLNGSVSCGTDLNRWPDALYTELGHWAFILHPVTCLGGACLRTRTFPLSLKCKVLGSKGKGE